jgi:Zn-dependent protease with chaperone function
MGQGRAPHGLLCPECGAGLEPLGNGTPAGARLICRRCGEIFRARPRAASTSAPRPAEPPPVGGLNLTLRGWALGSLLRVYRAGVFTGAWTMLALGGFVPVVGRWVRDEIKTWADVIEALGGVWVVAETQDPDADLGPAIVYGDAPVLFSAIGDVARRLGARPPQQVRLSYLPCCGVVAWKRSSALVLGLPLLHVLSMAELRAVLAHELAHLARGDATRSARSARFVHGLGQALDAATTPSRSPLRLWAHVCRRISDSLLAPIARGQEVRADRCAAAIAGGDAAAAALVKVALVQPLFREVLEHYDPADPGLPNLYAFFREFWLRLPDSLHTEMRLQLLAGLRQTLEGAHPPLPDRLTVVQSYPHRETRDNAAAKTALGDLEALEQMLHNRLFSTPGIEPSVFHRAGT